MFNGVCDLTDRETVCEIHGMVVRLVTQGDLIMVMKLTGGPAYEPQKTFLKKGLSKGF